MTNPTAAHPLDLVIWNALTTRHARLALGTPRAWRYPALIAPFAALADRSAESWQALEPLVPAGDRAVLFTVDMVGLPPQFELLLSRPLEQMVATSYSPPAELIEHLVLGEADVPEMQALVELTRPGPFNPRTIELGHYVGIRRDGRLAAMAGERMQLDGYTELSAICTHPDYRGHGFGRGLLDVVARGIVARGDTPFLHVWADNHTAIALYLKAGFSIRRQMNVTILKRRE